MKKFKDVIKARADKEKVYLEYLKGPGKNMVYDGYLEIIFEVDSEATFMKYVNLVKDIQLANAVWTQSLGRGVGAARIIYRDVYDDYVNLVLETIYNYRTEMPITAKLMEEIASVIRSSESSQSKKLLEAMRYYGAKDLLY